MHRRVAFQLLVLAILRILIEARLEGQLGGRVDLGWVSFLFSVETGLLPISSRGRGRASEESARRRRIDGRFSMHY